MGRTSLGNRQNGANWMVTVDRGTGPDFVFSRYGTIDDTRVEWEIWEYVGAAGGPNEFVVSYTGQVVLPVGTTNSSASTPGVSSKAVGFITGQRCNQTTGNANRTHSGLHYSVQNGLAFSAYRGNTDYESTCSYATVDFIGSNWLIARDTVFPTSQSHTHTFSIARDPAKTFTHCQNIYNNPSNGGLDDCHAKAELTSSTTALIETKSTDFANQEMHIWRITNSAADMNVTRYTGTMAGTGEEEIYTFSITTVPDTTRVALTGTADCTGSGTYHPRGSINYILQDASTVLLRQSDNGQTSRYVVEVIDFPQSSGGSTTYTGTGLGIESQTGTGAGTGVFTGTFSATALGLSNSVNVGTGQGSFTGQFNGIGSGLEVSTGTGQALGTFAGTLQGAGLGLSAQSGTGTPQGAFSGQFSGLGRGLEGANYVGLATAQFNGSFSAIGNGLEIATNTSPGNGQFTATFAGSGIGVETTSFVGTGTGILFGAFPGASNGLQNQPEIGKGIAASQGSFTGTGLGIDAKPEIPLANAAFIGVFAGTGKGLENQTATGAASAILTGNFPATGTGQVTQPNIGQASGFFVGLFTGAGNGLSVQSGVSSGVGAFSATFTSAGLG
ncbi:hypothetical protein D6827_03180, partial [Candidatus Parcubacteria bacterium]